LPRVVGLLEILEVVGNIFDADWSDRGQTIFRSCSFRTKLESEGSWRLRAFGGIEWGFSLRRRCLLLNRKPSRKGRDGGFIDWVDVCCR
jgi:hypothetical protein